MRDEGLNSIRLARRAMACEFEIVIVDGRDRDALVDIGNLALEEIQRLDGDLSCFAPTSEVSFVNAEAGKRPIAVGPDLFEILSAAKQVWRDTDGAFDITAGPLIDLWRAAEQTGTPPDERAIKDALGAVGMAHVLLDEETHSVRYDVNGLRINLGAVGKGYAVDKAASILREYDVQSALVSGGGSTVFAFGEGPDGEGWRVGIRHPSMVDERVAEIVLRDQAMSTSGGPAQRDKNVREAFEHIIDPLTGLTAESEAASVTVISDDAMLSDALATAFYLRGKALAEAYCRRYPTISTIFVSIDGRVY